MSMSTKRPLAGAERDWKSREQEFSRKLAAYDRVLALGPHAMKATAGDYTVLIHPSTRKPGWWQATFFDKEMLPWGDSESPTWERLLEHVKYEVDWDAAKPVGTRANRGHVALRPNDFRGAPRRTFLGIKASLAGFHTAASKEVTYGYAQMRAVPREAPDVEPDEARRLLLGNYPVTVTLDMKGLRALPDYDALRVREALQIAAEKALSEAAKNETDPLEELARTVDRRYVPPPDDAVQWLFHYGSSSIYYPAGALLAFAESKRDPSGFVRAVAASRMSDKDLTSMVGQFRYVKDVSSDRIVAVDYVQPWWPDVLDARIPQERRLGRALRDAGWSIIDVSDVEAGQLPVAEASVYRRRRPKGARLEYHGTSWRNLVAAAPELRLPVPPTPFEGGSD